MYLFSVALVVLFLSNVVLLCCGGCSLPPFGFDRDGGSRTQLVWYSLSLAATSTLPTRDWKANESEE